METRTAALPDGSEVTIAVEPGLAQDEVDVLAAQVWVETPEPSGGE
ncbi:hypothetical protein U9R90_05310 [Streptomyces sp. E11-3]